MKEQIANYMNQEISYYNNEEHDAEDFLETLASDIRTKFNVPCTYTYSHSFDGGPGYEATSYVIVAFHEGVFIVGRLLSEVY
jgi:hypothetical protein